MKDEIDWQTFIQKHLDGQTSEAEAATLSEQIVNNETVRHEYLKAARLHGALNDETLELNPETIPFPSSEPGNIRTLRAPVLPKQFAAAIVAGAFVALLGIGVAWAVSSPKSEAIFIPMVNGDFQSITGPIASGFPTQFGQWSGNPAEVVSEPNGSRSLRFLETGNVMGNPDGGATNCSVFQFVDLTSIQRQWNADRSESQLTLEISAQFRREAAPTDAALPKLEASIRVFLLRGELGSMENRWPELVREADALGKQSIKLVPGEKAATISTSCILNSEATIALIAVSANTRSGASTSIELGGYYVDDVQLTAIKQPNLPVRLVK